MTYAEKLKNPKWQRKRLEVLKRDKWRCKKCGDKETTLHVHHKSYEGGKEPWDYDNSTLTTLCQDCHREVESFKAETNIDDIYIFKSDKWSNDMTLIFATVGDRISMRIYQNESYIVGFNLDKYHLDSIKKLIPKLSKSTRNG